MDYQREWFDVSGALLAMLGAGGADVNLPASIVINASTLYPTDAIAMFQINVDGNIYKYDNGVLSGTSKWLYGGSASDYSVYLETLDTPYTGSDAVNSWISLASIKEWTCQENAQGTTSFTGTLKIARTSDTGSVLDTAVVNMDATADI